MDKKKLEKYVRETKMDSEFKPNSSNIKNLKYSTGFEILEIEFYGRGNGPSKTYRYYPVDEKRWIGIQKAESAGTYFFNNIRNDKDITTIQIN